MLLELADNGERGGRGIVNRSGAVQLPCKCLNGKIAYVAVPTDTGNVWMRADKFHTMLSDSGWQVDHTELSGFWNDVGGFFKKAGETALNIIGGGGSQQAPVTVNVPGGGGNDMMGLLTGLLLGKQQGAQAPAYTPAPASSGSKLLIPLAIGGGVLLVTLLLTQK